MTCRLIKTAAASLMRPIAHSRNKMIEPVAVWGNIPNTSVAQSKSFQNFRNSCLSVCMGAKSSGRDLKRAGRKKKAFWHMQSFANSQKTAKGDFPPVFYHLLVFLLRLPLAVHQIFFIFFLSSTCGFCASCSFIHSIVFYYYYYYFGTGLPGVPHGVLLSLLFSIMSRQAQRGKPLD